MKYSVDKSESESAYMQLYRQISADIASGAVPAGTKLPSKRTLSADTGVSVITVEHAYSLLCDEGYVESREKSGYFVLSAVGASPVKRVSIESMALSELPEDFPFSVFAKTMRSVLSRYDRKILARIEGPGCMELRCALSDYLERARGIKASPEQIVIGSGAEYLYSLIVLLLGRERTVALEEPSYEKIRRVYELCGARIKMLPIGEDGIESESLNECRADILHVTPYHSYPSGVTATAKKRREYALWTQKNNAYIVEDDYDSEFSPAGVSTVFSLSPETVIYVNTFSKSIAPSIRTGYMVLPETLVDMFRKKLGFLSCTVPLFEQLVLAEFISQGHMERCINRRRRRLKNSNDEKNSLQIDS